MPYRYRAFAIDYDGTLTAAEEAPGVTAGLWLIGWLFTIGLLQLPFGRAALALVVWKYYLGATLRSLLP